MPLYKVLGNWVHTELRIVEAENKKAAEKAYANSQYERVIDWSLSDFIDVESVEVMSRAEALDFERETERRIAEREREKRGY